MKKSIIAALRQADSSQSQGGGSSQASSSSQAAGSVVITLDKEVMSVGVNETTKINPQSETQGLTYQFESNKPDIATVDNEGNVTGVKEGTAKITVSAVGKTGKAICEVTVVGEYYIEEETEILVQTTFNDTYGQIFKDAITSLAKKEPHLTVKYDKYSSALL